MKLKNFKRVNGYIFYFVFKNGERGEVDIEEIIASYVGSNELDSAFLDEDWGCLEFKNHTVDIEPKTLYKYFLKNRIVTQMAS